MTQPDASNGRYRFQGQQPLDPNADVHPEMLSTASMEAVSGHIPNTPNDLIAMQESEPRANRPEKPERKRSEKVTQVLELIKTLSTSPADDQAIALSLLNKLEDVHDQVVSEMADDNAAKHTQIISWAVDADRLYQARLLLQNVEMG
jgi:hypothetical protein